MGRLRILSGIPASETSNYSVSIWKVLAATTRYLLDQRFFCMTSASIGEISAIIGIWSDAQISFGIVRKS